MSVLLVSESDIGGGAALAAYRLHRALLASGADSRMLVQRKLSDDWTVQGPRTLVGRALAAVRPQVGSSLMRVQSSANAVLHSPAVLPSRLHGAINRSGAGVVHLHWVCGEMLSIGDISRIQKPVVWTLHDTWPFCGTEHYPGNNDRRYQTGYRRNNRPPGDGGLDIDRWTWRRKKRAWKTPMTVVASSRWMAEQARSSILMREWPIHVIPNPIDTDVFKPIDKAFSRRVLNLPQNRPILLFGAIGGVKDLRKGFDLLLDALRCLKAGTLTDLLCVVCGQFTPASPPPIPYETRWMAQVHDDPLLVLLYNAADVLVVPSRQDNLPQTATEAQACGCPVVAFRATGLPDIVAHDETGYLAEPYDPTGLAAGVTKLLADETFRNQVASAARQHALNRWRASDIARQMMRIYDSLASSIPRPTL